MRYVVWKPGKEEHAKIMETDTAWEARKACAVNGISPHDLCAMRQEHLAFVGPGKRHKLETAVEEVAS